LLAVGGRDRTPVAFYAERELGGDWYNRPTLFLESVGLPRRSSGPGPQPVQPTNAATPSVGSEGIVANIIGQVAKRDARFISHPGPDKIRQHHVRTFCIVTDFVGSGRRVREYLDAAWRNATVRSWHSFGLLRFVVASYAATTRGKRLVEKHPARPEVMPVVMCQTVSELGDAWVGPCMELCRAYDPLRKRNDEPDWFLGYGGVGALVAFAHGCPNNVPRIFTGRGGSNKWQPLFRQRIVDGSLARGTVDVVDGLVTRRKLEMLGTSPQLAKQLTERALPSGLPMLLYLQAVSSGPRHREALARRTGLPLKEIAALANAAAANGWISDRGLLTEQGRSQLKAPGGSTRVKPIYGPVELAYYPGSLRAPRTV
jgi:hypothetical protein